MAAILDAARRKNASLSITGMLLYTEGSFFQVLEGPSDALASLLATIKNDSRHASVTKIIDEPIARRDFPDWKMGYSHVSQHELVTIDGLTDFFQNSQSLVHMPPGRAKRLLGAFAAGRWRLRGN